MGDSWRTGLGEEFMKKGVSLLLHYSIRQSSRHIGRQKDQIQSRERNGTGLKSNRANASADGNQTWFLIHSSTAAHNESPMSIDVQHIEVNPDAPSVRSGNCILKRMELSTRLVTSYSSNTP
jgi:hypothetical protein